MTNDEMRIAIAECCGWKHTPQRPNPGTAAGMLPDQFTMGNLTTYSCPNYPEDLNACHEMEKGVDQHEYRISLAAVCARANHHPYQATARQRCEAFLKVKGRWKE